MVWQPTREALPQRNTSGSRYVPLKRSSRNITIPILVRVSRDKWANGRPEVALTFYPCLLCPSDNMCRFQRADVPLCTHFFFYSFHTFLDHSTNIIRKVRAPRCVSTNDVQECHLDKKTWIIHQCTGKTGSCT